MTNDPRGPIRTIKEVDLNSGGIVLIKFVECDHVGERINHFHYRVGDETRCFQCGKEITERVK